MEALAFRHIVAIAKVCFVAAHAGGFSAHQEESIECCCHDVGSLTKGWDKGNPRVDKKSSAKPKVLAELGLEKLLRGVLLGATRALSRWAY